MKTFAISVITPVFNGAAYIQNCLDQVADQGREDVEHLIVDGGSNDGTVELVEARQSRDQRVRLIRGPDRGQAHAMNKGVISANAPVIGCLNVDDGYADGALGAAISVFKSTERPTFFWGACEVRDSLSQNTWTQRPGKFVAWRMMLGWDFEPHPVNPAAYFYHRSIHFSAGLYDEVDHYALDLDMLLRIAISGVAVQTTEEVLGIYNLLPGTKTFDDSMQGTSAPRAERVRLRYIDQLPYADRWRIRLVRARRALRASLTKGTHRSL